MSQAIPIVFIVDDDVSVRESLELLIDSAGWQSRTFASAQAFLARPEVPLTPSCLVLDVNLPNLTGLELQERVVLDRLDMPIILISGYDDVGMTDRAMRTGAIAFLTKPLDADVLLRTIQQAIEQSCAAFVHEPDVGASSPENHGGPTVNVRRD